MEKNELELRREFLILRRWITDLYGHPGLGNYDNAKIKKQMLRADEILKLIDSRPAPSSEWIPVSERLPEEEGYYYVTDIDPKTGERYVEYTFYFADSGFDSYNAQAWMDWFPSPYSPPSDEGV